MSVRRRVRSLGALGAVWILLISSLQLTPFTIAAAPAGWTTSGPLVGFGDQATGTITSPFTIAGITWYGFETTGFVAHGLWARDYKQIIDRVAALGYNTIQIPFSNQMWEENPVPKPNLVSLCPSCRDSQGKTLRSRDILAGIVNYAGAKGLHVILENHRSTAGNGPQENGLWYTTSRRGGYPESKWIGHWVGVQEWAMSGATGRLAPGSTVLVDYLAADGLPIVLGYDLRAEPHTPARSSYLDGATWGTGDGGDPAKNPNPNPFTLGCVATSTCHDWRLAAERAADTILGKARENGWAYPLIFVQGIGQYPKDGGNAAGPYDYYWWGGNLLGVNGNATNPGAPIVLNAGGNAGSLGPPVEHQLVYTAHDYGPSLYRQGWFNGDTCYRSGCSSSSLADVWWKYWAHLNLGEGVNPVWVVNGVSRPYPWGNTGHSPYYQTPVRIGEFGTGNADADLSSSVRGSQGQWFTDLVNFIGSSYSSDTLAPSYPGFRLTALNWTYWALNGEDSYGLLASNYVDLANAQKQNPFLCSIQQPRPSGCAASSLPAPH